MPAGTWTTHYEDLRRRAQDDGGGTDGSWGLALFLRQGLRAWMRACPVPSSSFADAHPPTTVAPPTPISAALPSSTAPVVPTDLTRQLVPVLASMILARRACLQEVAYEYRA